MKFIKLSVFICLLCKINIMYAETTTEKQCMEKWMHIEQQNMAVEEMLNTWADMHTECGETGVYYYWLGWLLNALGEFTEAEKSFKKGLSYNSHYEQHLLVGLGDVYYRIGKVEKNTLAYERAALTYQKVIKRYPDWFNGYLSMSSLELSKGNDTDAIQYALKANSLEETALAYRNLVIAYQHTAEFDNSLDAMGMAYELDSNMFSEKYMMYSAALSYLGLNNYEMAVNFLATLVKNNPGVKGEASFVQLLEHMKKEIEKAPNYDELRNKKLKELEKGAGAT